MTAPATTKFCGGCRRTLPLADFSTHKLMPDGKQTRCKACSNAAGKAWRATRSDGLGSGGALSRSRAGRLAWLLAHPDLWREAPSDRDDVTDEGRAILLAVGQQMVNVWLYSPQTEIADRSWGIRVLISEARKRLEMAKP